MPLALVQEYYNQTTLHPVGLVALIALGGATFLVPRRYALLPIVIMTCCVPAAQRVVIATLDFHLIRIMVLVGWLRVISRGEHKHFVWRPLDKVMLAYALINLFAYTVREANVARLVQRLGNMYDAVGMYFLFRFLIRDWKDVERVATTLMWLSLPIVAVFAWEKKTGINLFANLGGVPAHTIIRDGELRCQGPFPHPILAGYFWASLLPIFASSWWRGLAMRPLVVASLVASSGIVVLSSATTPLLGGVAGMGAMGLYVIRRYMKPLRWAVLGLVVVLHVVMKAPVWHLLGRVNVVTGSTGYHRFRLIDAAIGHIDEWFVIGTESTGHWGRQMFDLTNQYVREGVKGGFVGLVLFCAILGYGFQGVGRSWRRAPRLRTRMLIWSLGCFLFSNALMFLAISFSYSRQNLVPWYFVLAALATLAPATAARTVRRRASLPVPIRPSVPGAPASPMSSDPRPARQDGDRGAVGLPHHRGLGAS